MFSSRFFCLICRIFGLFFHSFDDEADIDFVKFYLRGIKDEVRSYVLNYNKEFDLVSYIRAYVNEFRFSSVKTFSVTENKNYVKDLTGVYLNIRKGMENYEI